MTTPTDGQPPTSTRHVPVMLSRILDLLAPALDGVDGAVHLDGTLGMGGHAEAVLERQRAEEQALREELEREEAEAALREVGEEIGLRLAPEVLEPLGHVRTAAANEPGFTLLADVFLAPCAVDPQPAAEIEELRWIDPRQLSAEEQRDPELAPLLYDCVRMWPHTA
mgnify:CR=1 FL=1